MPGVSSALAERLTGGRYVDVDIDRAAAARYGLNIADVQSVVASLIGGENIGETVEGLARYPINVRYPREWRDTPEKLAALPILTPGGSQITLGTVAAVRLSDGPPMLKSENARPLGLGLCRRARPRSRVHRGRSAAGRGRRRQARTRHEHRLFRPVRIHGARQRAAESSWCRPPCRSSSCCSISPSAASTRPLLIMATLPFALTGGVWFLYAMGYHLSIATGVGFIALAGVSAEFGVIMLLYLKNAWTAQQAAGQAGEAGLQDAIREGAVQRVRPKAMTVAVIVAGLLPIMVGSGTGSEVMSRIAAPMVGGMMSAPLLSLFVVPAAYWLMRRRAAREAAGHAE